MKKLVCGNPAAEVTARAKKFKLIAMQQVENEFFLIDARNPLLALIATQNVEDGESARLPEVEGRTCCDGQQQCHAE